MVIGIDASRANIKHKTGTEWYSFYIIKYLVKIDKDNKYILYLNKSASKELLLIIKDNPNFSIKILSWPFSSFWTLGRLSLEMIFHAPDLLFVPAHVLPLVLPKKVLTTIHDIAFTRESNLYRYETAKVSNKLTKKFISLFATLITKGKYKANSVDYLQWSTIFALHKATKIITVSDFTKEEILRVYSNTDKEKLLVVHNGFNNNLYHQINNINKIEEVLSKHGIEFPYFLYIGRLEKKKNTSYLIEGFAIAKENNPNLKEKLILIGMAGYGYDETRYVIEEFNLNKEVFMLGWVDEKELPYIYNGARAFVFPSRHEGFGIPIIQSLACGIPTIASNLTVFKEIAGDSVLYFDKNNKKEIANSLERISSDNKLREELIVKGLKVVKKYSWRKCAEETLDIINSL